MVSTSFKAFKGLLLYSLVKVGLIKNNFWEQRMNKCSECPIQKNLTCNSDFFVFKQKNNYYKTIHINNIKDKNAESFNKMNRGCGCIVILKTQLKEESCPANFW